MVSTIKAMKTLIKAETLKSIRFSRRPTSCPLYVTGTRGRRSKWHYTINKHRPPSCSSSACFRRAGLICQEIGCQSSWPPRRHHMGHAKGSISHDDVRISYVSHHNIFNKTTSFPGHFSDILIQLLCTRINSSRIGVHRTTRTIVDPETVNRWPLLSSLEIALQIFVGSASSTGLDESLWPPPSPPAAQLSSKVTLLFPLPILRSSCGSQWWCLAV